MEVDNEIYRSVKHRIKEKPRYKPKKLHLLDVAQTEDSFDDEVSEQAKSQHTKRKTKLRGPI